MRELGILLKAGCICRLVGVPCSEGCEGCRQGGLQASGGQVIGGSAGDASRGGACGVPAEPRRCGPHLLPHPDDDASRAHCAASADANALVFFEDGHRSAITEISHNTSRKADGTHRGTSSQRTELRAKTAHRQLCAGSAKRSSSRKACHLASRRSMHCWPSRSSVNSVVSSGSSSPADGQTLGHDSNTSMHDSQPIEASPHAFATDAPDNTCDELVSLFV